MPHSHHSHSGAFCAHAAAGTSPRSMTRRASDLGFHVYHLTEHVPRPHPHLLYPEEREEGLSPEKLEQRFEAYLKEARSVQRDQRSFAAQDTPGPSASATSSRGRDQRRRVDVLVGAETEWIDERTADYLARVIHHGPPPRDAGQGGSVVVDSGAPPRLPRAPRLGRGRVDFLVGSSHHVLGVPIDFDRPTFRRALALFARRDEDGDARADSSSPPSSDVSDGYSRLAHLRLASAYADEQYSMLRRFRPEVVGHFDLCRIYHPDLPMLLPPPSPSVRQTSPPSHPSSTSSTNHLTGVDPPPPPPRRPLSDEEVDELRGLDARVRRNVRYAASYGALFELSSAALRKGWSTPYPGTDVAQLIASVGGRFCLSDDAHSHVQVGLGYAASRGYLDSLGVDSLWYLERDDAAGGAGRPPSDAVRDSASGGGRRAGRVGRGGGGPADEDGEERDEEEEEDGDDEDEEEIRLHRAAQEVMRCALSPGSTEARRADDDASQAARRGHGHQPLWDLSVGASAPTRFARGTRARRMDGDEWRSLPFWDELESRRERLTASESK